MEVAFGEHDLSPHLPLADHLFLLNSPFVQRVWISLEAKKLSYQYIELDPYKKPDWYLKLNPRGLIPTLQHEDWCCGESTVLMEYVSLQVTNHVREDNSNLVVYSWKI